MNSILKLVPTFLIFCYLPIPYLYLQVLLSWNCPGGLWGARTLLLLRGIDWRGLRSIRQRWCHPYTDRLAGRMAGSSSWPLWRGDISENWSGSRKPWMARSHRYQHSQLPARASLPPLPLMSLPFLRFQLVRPASPKNLLACQQCLPTKHQSAKPSSSWERVDSTPKGFHDAWRRGLSMPTLLMRSWSWQHRKHLHTNKWWHPWWVDPCLRSTGRSLKPARN